MPRKLDWKKFLSPQDWSRHDELSNRITLFYAMITEAGSERKELEARAKARAEKAATIRFNDVDSR